MNSNIISLTYLLILTPKLKLLKLDNYFWKLILIKYFSNNYKKTKDYILEYKKNKQLNKIIKIFNYECNNDDLEKYTTIAYKINIKLIPTEIGILKNLISFQIYTSYINLIPNEIGLLINLKYFTMNHSYIKTLPKNIGLLINLKHMYLGYNKLEFVPKTIGLLINLKILSVKQNKLKTLPSEINLLYKLELIYINDNKEDLKNIFLPKFQNLFFN
jgi:Leucine-rich repeat (LRR) protein